MFHTAKYLVFCVSFFSNLNSYCHSQFIEQQADVSINELYHSIKSLPNNSSISKRLDWFSGHFKNSAYVLGSLGEGPKGRYDQFPLYRTDAFDCDTYVNTVVALALSNSLKNFRQCVNHLRYNHGKVSYISRNHFTSVDWNKMHQKKGLFKDITLNVHDHNNKSVAKYASTLIDKPNWYEYKTISTIRIDGQDKALQKQRLAELKGKSKVLEVRTSKLPYIPLSTLFPQPNKPNLYLFSQIPNGAIIEIVRPNWDLRDKIGTNLDISHLGFAFWHKKTLYFRQASSQYGKVVDVPLITYLQEALTSPTIKGINVQIVLPQKPGYCGR
jgi:hypothetical protein